MPRKPKVSTKIYVLDTSVIIHDHNSFLSFEDNDIAIPITVLEELDNFKRGNDTKNFEAREFTRIVDKLSEDHTLQDWIPLGKGMKSKFKIIFADHNLKVNAEKVFDDRKGDHKILNAALSLQEQEKERKVILVTKDINLRIKAKALNIVAEDYNTGKVKDVSDLHLGKEKVDNLPSEVIKEIYEKGYLEDYSFLENRQQKQSFLHFKKWQSKQSCLLQPI